MKNTFNGYTLTDNPDSVNLDKVCTLLGDSYWAENRDREIIRQSIENSLCISVLDEKMGQVGFARVVTDGCTFSWIADVIVDKTHRGRGIGKAIMQFIQDHPDIPASVQLLVTADAHGLYEQFGFRRSEALIKRCDSCCMTSE